MFFRPGRCASVPATACNPFRVSLARTASDAAGKNQNVYVSLGGAALAISPCSSIGQPGRIAARRSPASNASVSLV